MAYIYRAYCYGVGYPRYDAVMPNQTWCNVRRPMNFNNTVAELKEKGWAVKRVEVKHPLPNHNERRPICVPESKVYVDASVHPNSPISRLIKRDRDNRRTTTFCLVVMALALAYLCYVFLTR